MSYFMRRHKRLIFFFTLVAVFVPFVFFIPGVDFTTIFLGQDQVTGEEPVIKVGDATVTVAEFMGQYNAVASNRGQSGVTPTAGELVADGTVEQIVENLTNRALVEAKGSGRPFSPSRDLLVEELKAYPMFQDDKGQFDKALWNQWVKQMDGGNWNRIYESVREGLSQKVMGEVLQAPARIFEADIRKSHKDANLKMRVKYAAVEPKVEVTDDQLLNHYNLYPTKFMAPEERTAEFVRISLKPPVPELAYDIVARAATEDFAALATQYSEGPDKADGGNLGWVIETVNLPGHEKVLFTMTPGQVSDIIEGPTGLHIYKVEEERTSELAGKRDVRARQIVLRPKLDPAEKEKRLEQAQGLVVTAKSNNDLRMAAQVAGLEPATSSSFSIESTEIDNVDKADAINFRRELSKVAQDQVSEVVEGRNFLYVAKIIATVPTRQLTLDEAREKVEKDAIATHKQSPEYAERVQKYTDEIKATAANLGETKTKFPDLDFAIKETKEFVATDFLFSDGIYWNCRDAVEELRDNQPGALGGPIKDFASVNYFIELIEKKEPDEAELAAKWETEKENLRNAALTMARSELEQDYVSYLREQAEKNFQIEPNNALIEKLLGLDTEPEPPTVEAAPETTVETPEATEAPAVEPSADATGTWTAPASETSPAPDATPETETPAPAPAQP